MVNGLHSCYSTLVRVFAKGASQAEGLSNAAVDKEQSPYWPGVGGPILLFMLALFFFARPLLLLGDGGSCRHILNGLYILQHHALPVSTYISGVEHAPWTTHELLCDLLFGLPFPIFGLNWVVLSSALAISLSLTWAYQMARFRGSGALASLLILLLSLEACTIHWLARPHVFSYMLFIAFYFECFIAQRSLKMRSIILSVLMLVWGNLHGSFPLGLLMIAARGLGDFIQKRVSQSQEDNLWTAKESALILLTAGLASCLNLRGVGFLGYVVGYLSSPKIHANSDEWRSFDFAFPAPACAFIALELVLSGFWFCSKLKPRLAEFMYMLFLFAASIYAMRLIPYFALAVLPAVAVQCHGLFQKEGLGSIPVLGALVRADERASKSELQLSKQRWVFCGLGALLGLVFLSAPGFTIVDFDPLRLPVKAVDYMKEQHIGGLGFVRDNWGAYLYWRLKEPIFIDDETDFYSQTLIDDYSSIIMTRPGWERSLSKFPFKFILIPCGLPLESLLQKNNLWKQVYKDQTAVLFTR